MLATNLTGFLTGKYNIMVSFYLIMFVLPAFIVILAFVLAGKKSRRNE